MKVRVQALLNGNLVQYKGSQLRCTSIDECMNPSFQQEAESIQESQVAYVLHLKHKEKRWTLLTSFSILRQFRNDLLKRFNKLNPEDCALMTDEVKQILKYGFPERKLFGSKTNTYVAHCAYNIENCLQGVIDAHSACASLRCPFQAPLDMFLQISAHCDERSSAPELNRRRTVDVPHRRASHETPRHKAPSMDSAPMPPKMQHCARSSQMRLEKPVAERISTRISPRKTCMEARDSRAYTSAGPHNPNGLSERLWMNRVAEFKRMCSEDMSDG